MFTTGSRSLPSTSAHVRANTRAGAYADEKETGTSGIDKPKRRTRDEIRQGLDPNSVRKLAGSNAFEWLCWAESCRVASPSGGSGGSRSSCCFCCSTHAFCEQKEEDELLDQLGNLVDGLKFQAVAINKVRALPHGSSEESHALFAGTSVFG